MGGGDEATQDGVDMRTGGVRVSFRLVNITMRLTGQSGDPTGSVVVSSSWGCSSPPTAPVRFAAVAMDGNGDGNWVAVAAATAAPTCADDNVTALALSLAFAAGLHLAEGAATWQALADDEQDGQAHGDHSGQ